MDNLIISYYWFVSTLFEIRAINNAVWSLTTDILDVDFFEREKSMIRIKSSCMKIQHNIIKESTK